MIAMPIFPRHHLGQIFGTFEVFRARKLQHICFGTSSNAHIAHATEQTFPRAKHQRNQRSFQARLYKPVAIKILFKFYQYELVLIFPKQSLNVTYTVK